MLTCVLYRAGGRGTGPSRAEQALSMQCDDDEFGLVVTGSLSNSSQRMFLENSEMILR